MVKHLSRDALYAPLSNYTSASKSKSKDTPTDKIKNLSNTLKEKSLYTFLETVSSEYHDSSSIIGLKNGGSNGGNGLKASHMEKLLAQRALTLIKGGFHTSVAKSTDQNVDSGVNVNVNSGKKRGRKNGVFRHNGSMSNKKRKRLQEKSGKTNSSKVGDIRGDVLVGLNQMWNEYIDEMLPKKKESGSFSFDPAQITSLASKMELIGAYVSIQESRSTSYSGKKGFIVDSIKNIWKIAIQKGDKSPSDFESLSQCNEWKLILLPKRDSALLIVFNIRGESLRVLASGITLHPR
eukprot:525315_1